MSDESEAVGHHDLAMPDSVYESDPAAEPDTNFVAGELSLAAAETAVGCLMRAARRVAHCGRLAAL